MDDYIKRKDALKAFCNWCGCCPPEKRDPEGCDDILQGVLDDVPSADVRPVTLIGAEHRCTVSDVSLAGEKYREICRERVRAELGERAADYASIEEIVFPAHDMILFRGELFLGRKEETP